MPYKRTIIILVLLAAVLSFAYVAGRMVGLYHKRAMAAAANLYHKKVSKDEALLRSLHKEKKQTQPTNTRAAAAKESVPKYPKATEDFQKTIAHRSQTNAAVLKPKPLVEPKKSEMVTRGHLGKAQLAVIIDDVSTLKQLRRIRKTGLALTPSIFPPSRMNLKSHLLAARHPHAMIHLPTESGSAKFNRQKGMLFRSDTKASIEAKIKRLRKLFPTVRHVNNHTGSRFTSDKKAMRRLLSALYKNGFVFIDSYTTPKSQVRSASEELGLPYIKRDVFLDNVRSRSAIRKQLRKAVRIAKRKGRAVAIAHPHPVTLKTLAQSKDILKDIKVVYIDTMFGGR